MKPELKKAMNHPFFAGLTETDMDLVADCAMPVQMKEGEWVFHEGEPANRFYLIHSGKVELNAEGTDKQQMTLEILGPGDVLGWSWLFPPYYWHFGAKVIEPIQATFFYGTRLREILERNPALGYELMQRFVQVLLHRLQATRQKLIDSSSSSPGKVPSS